MKRIKFNGAIGVEIKLRPGQDTYRLPDTATLRRRKIKHIVFCESLVAVAPSGISAAQIGVDFDNAYISLTRYATQTFTIDRINLQEFSTARLRGYVLPLNDVYDLPASRIEVSGNLLTEEKSIFLLFLFEEPAISRPNASGVRELNYFEVPLHAQRSVFPENNNLRGVPFQNVFCSFPALTANNREGVTEAQASRMYLTLQKNNLQFFQNVPLLFLHQIANCFLYDFEGITFDFPYSFIDTVNFVADDKKTVFFNCIVKR